MHARIREVMDKRQNGEKGFTLIELLVVIIIIGILAAIAIPTFLNQRQKGWVSQVESDLKNAAIAAESYAVDNNGSYAGLDTAASASTGNAAPTVGAKWKDNGFNATKGVSITFAEVDGGTAYTLTGKHASLGERSWVYSSKTGTITETGK